MVTVKSRAPNLIQEKKYSRNDFKRIKQNKNTSPKFQKKDLWTAGWNCWNNISTLCKVIEATPSQAGAKRYGWTRWPSPVSGFQLTSGETDWGVGMQASSFGEVSKASWSVDVRCLQHCPGLIFLIQVFNANYTLFAYCVQHRDLKRGREKSDLGPV